MANYDEAILQSYANSLYIRASWIIAKCTILGGVIGAATAYAPHVLSSSALPDNSSQMIFLGVLGAAVGYSIGESRAFEYKLRAQVALCQRQIEMNTRR